MNMYTNPKYRRKGIAYRTLDMLIKDSKSKGISAISLEATDMGRSLYEKYGFVKMNNEMGECIEEGILEEFLKKHRAEAKAMSIFEYDQEKHLRMEREEAWEEGRREGEENTKRIFKLSLMGKTSKEIAEVCGIPEEKVKQILE